MYKRLGSVKEVQYTQCEVAKNHDPQSAQMSSSDDDSDYCYSVKSDYFVGACGEKTSHMVKESLHIKGYCELSVETAAKIHTHRCFVVKVNHGALLGYPKASELELIKEINKATKPDEKNSNLFKGVRKLKTRK